MWSMKQIFKTFQNNIAVIWKLQAEYMLFMLYMQLHHSALNLFWRQMHCEDNMGGQANRL